MLDRKMNKEKDRTQDQPRNQDVLNGHVKVRHIEHFQHHDYDDPSRIILPVNFSGCLTLR